MREYKFKAFWHKDKVTTFVDTIEFLQGGIRVSDGCCHTGWQGKDCELKEFTGLPDKNGKEVYEGDIVKAHDRLCEPEAQMANFVGVVKYDNGSFCVQSLDGTYRNYRWADMEIEIIGNVFEDGDLIDN